MDQIVREEGEERKALELTQTSLHPVLQKKLEKWSFLEILVSILNSFYFFGGILKVHCVH